MTKIEIYEAILQSRDIPYEAKCLIKEELADERRRVEINQRINEARNQETRQIENDILRLLSLRGDMFAVDIASALGITTAKITGVCLSLEREKLLERFNVSIRGKGMRTMYRLPA